MTGEIFNLIKVRQQIKLRKGTEYIQSNEKWMQASKKGITEWEIGRHGIKIKQIRG